MPANHTILSPSNTGDGDLGLLAMESRSPSTSFDTNYDSRSRAAELSAIPTYPTPPSVNTPTFTSQPLTASSPRITTLATATATSDHTPTSRVGTRISSDTNIETLASGSALTSSATSSRLGAMSLQDHLSQDPASQTSGAPPLSSASALSTLTRGQTSHVATDSISSSSSAYSSAAESPGSERVPPTTIPATAPSSAVPLAFFQQHQPAFSSSSPPPSTSPPASISQQSIASNSTITQARLPTSRSLASTFSQHAMSVEQELDADLDQRGSATDLDDSRLRSREVAARSSRRSRRSGLPAPQDRLPVGQGGPSAPPRSASFRDASKRLSVGAGHGDLGVDAYSGSATGPSSPSMTSFLDLDSPRTSESSSTGRYPVPSRRTSLNATSPKNTILPVDAVHFASNNPIGSTAASNSAPSSTSRPASSNSKKAFANAKAEKNGAPAAISTLALDREAMQRWVLSVGCVNFDLELGPDLEFLYPPLGISREERDNIAFSSFPDTSIFDDGSLVFSWRVREVPLDSSASEAPTIKSLDEALSQSVGDEETPRPSMNKAALQNAMRKKKEKEAEKKANNQSLPTSPTSPSTSGFRDSSASSNASGHALSRQASDANLNHGANNNTSVGMPGTTSFHERLTQKLFSSGSSGMARHFSHDRHSSSHSMSSASADDEGDPSLSATNGSTNTGVSPADSPISQPSSTTSEVIVPRKTGNSTSSSYIYGYVFFRQKRDSTNRRGYFQKSVVILSHLPFVGLFSEVVARLGPLYFEHGMSMFEAFANDIMGWPTPQPGTILTLPLLGSIITAAIPFGQQPQNSPNAESAPMLSSLSSSSTGPGGGGGGFRNAAATMTIRSRSRHSSAATRELPEPLIGPEGPLLASVPATSLFETFKEALGDLWLLWECVLLAEPILVIAPQPKIASEAVWHMLDLIRPIPFAGDFRPYFHIHDYDFRTLVTKNKPNAGTLVAATNPFFATACSHWPHVLRVGKGAVKLIQIKHGSTSGGMGSNGIKKPSGVSGGGIGGGTGAGGGGPDHIAGFTTKRKRRISKDRALLKKLQDVAILASKSSLAEDSALASAIQSANVTMRRYFADLTERFLSPLNRYVASLVPASFDLGSPSEVPRIRPFNTTDFLASLKAHGTPLAIRSRSLPTGASVRQSLYMDFLRCPNFSLWLHSRVAAAEEEQRRRYISSLLQGDVTAFGRSRGEIETIDLYSRLVEEIRLVDVQLTSPTEPGPGSRWRTDKPMSNINTWNRAQKAAGSELGSAAGSGRNTPTFVGTSANNATTTEKRLLDQKQKLMSQLDKLCQTLPDDLRSSLRRPN
ncbi:uncharacterized protein MEPE_00465 [Melanopsichium pennsylvanicum]|uniref:UDENN domain-containing protein n=2 Tax=Melanopsichium pennsylvanicum TaxID=63383 RepID=A0AAJ4XGR4_9BASI|nr:conserved hypothetical protein [Melanopsichium pennsylvanicum 4]SNX81760.1 uncharacterized protein MEPE_00465 [Melanopsichium pennsylvanicum]